jgi:hypothetical protein
LRLKTERLDRSQNPADSSNAEEPDKHVSRGVFVCAGV